MALELFGLAMAKVAAAAANNAGDHFHSATAIVSLILEKPGSESNTF
ncbi:MAG: hypothetical protein WBN48_09515 [Thiogranum sp.]